MITLPSAPTTVCATLADTGVTHLEWQFENDEANSFFEVQAAVCDLREFDRGEHEPLFWLTVDRTTEPGCRSFLHRWDSGIGTFRPTRICISYRVRAWIGPTPGRWSQHVTLHAESTVPMPTSKFGHLFFSD